MPHKEKDLTITILQMYTNATRDEVQMDIKTVGTKLKNLKQTFKKVLRVI